MTSRLRTRASPVARYSRQSFSASSVEILLLGCVASIVLGSLMVPLGGAGHSTYRPHGVDTPSPIGGIRPLVRTSKAASRVDAPEGGATAPAALEAHVGHLSRPPRARPRVRGD